MPGERVRNGDALERAVDREISGQNTEPTLGDLFTSLTGDLSTLVRQEIELARTETMEKVTSATRSIVMMVAGGMVAYTGLIAVVIAIIVALSGIMDLWLSALIVGIVVIVVGAILIASGRSKLASMSVVPQKTVESMKENTEWAKEQVK